MGLQLFCPLGRDRFGWICLERGIMDEQRKNGKEAGLRWHITHMSHELEIWATVDLRPV